MIIEVKFVGLVVAVGVLVMVAGDIRVQPYHAELCYCRYEKVQQILCSHPTIIFYPHQSTKMTSLSTNEPMNTEEQQKLNNLITLQMEALGPARIQKLITTCYKSKAPYVPGATLRVRDLAYLTENGFLTPDEAVKVKAWRSKCAIFLNNMCAHCSLQQLPLPAPSS